MITHQELGNMTLQRLAYILPQTMEEETMVKEVFDQRAKVSTYQTLTTIDVKLGWQEEILQKYVNEKRETMAPENPASLTPEEESNLDAAVVTKEKELALQAILDKRNKKQKGLVEKVTSEVTGTAFVPEMSEITGSGTINSEGNIESDPIQVKKVTKRLKK